MFFCIKPIWRWSLTSATPRTERGLLHTNPFGIRPTCTRGIVRSPWAEAIRTDQTFCYRLRAARLETRHDIKMHSLRPLVSLVMRFGGSQNSKRAGERTARVILHPTHDSYTAIYSAPSANAERAGKCETEHYGGTEKRDGRTWNTRTGNGFLSSYTDVNYRRNIIRWELETEQRH